MTTETMTTETRSLKAIRSEIRSKGYAFQSILGFDSDPKTQKSNAAGSEFLTGIVYLQPDYRTCHFSKMAKCDGPCLNLSGRGGMSNVQLVRHDRTRAFYEDNDLFLELLRREIQSHIVRSTKKGLRPALRLNGTSDIDWSEIVRDFPEVTFYDYTKDLSRLRKWINDPESMPKNYSVTLSYSSASCVYSQRCFELMDLSPTLNLAVVFRDIETLHHFMDYGFHGRAVIDGDKTDLRFLDPKGVIVGLYAKGPAKKDTSGFVIDRH